MNKYQVTIRELVYVDRTYEVEAEYESQAEFTAKNADGLSLVHEQIGDTYSFFGDVVSVDLVEEG